MLIFASFGIFNNIYRPDILYIVTRFPCTKSGKDLPMISTRYNLDFYENYKSYGVTCHAASFPYDNCGNWCTLNNLAPI